LAVHNFISRFRKQLFFRLRQTFFWAGKESLHDAVKIVSLWQPLPSGEKRRQVLHERKALRNFAFAVLPR
jgi:hypothetical protein